MSMELRIQGTAGIMGDDRSDHLPSASVLIFNPTFADSGGGDGFNLLKRFGHSFFHH